MGLISTILGESAAAPITAAGNALNSLFTSDDERNTALIKLDAQQQAAMALQVDLNKTEASTGKWFIAGWRPAVGWVCTLALFNEYLINPWLQWATGHAGPVLDMSQLSTLLLSILGFGYIRTVEKTKGINTK